MVTCCVAEGMDLNRRLSRFLILKKVTALDQQPQLNAFVPDAQNSLLINLINKICPNQHSIPKPISNVIKGRDMKMSPSPQKFWNSTSSHLVVQEIQTNKLMKTYCNESTLGVYHGMWPDLHNSEGVLMSLWHRHPWGQVINTYGVP